jgi:hypothetical protein
MNEKKLTILNKEYKREATVYLNDASVPGYPEVEFTVILMENDQVVDTRIINGYNLDYASDCAENFVNKWGEWNDRPADFENASAW